MVLLQNISTGLWLFWDNFPHKKQIQSETWTHPTTSVVNSDFLNLVYFAKLLTSDPSFPTFCPVLVFLKMSYLLLVFGVLRASKYATIIKMWQISELPELCREYQNVANFATIYYLQLPGMRIFSGSAKSHGFCLARTDLVNRPDLLRYFCTNIGRWGSLFPMIN